MEPERVGDPSGSHARNGAGVSIWSVEGVGGGVHELVVAVIQSDEHTRFLGNGGLGEAGAFHRLPGGLQQQAVLRVHRRGFFFGDAEELGVEVAHVVQERAPLAHRPTRYARLGVVVVVDVPTIGGYLCDQILAVQQRFPEAVR